MITQIKPGLVALYDIRPGNGAGPFLQPRSPHGALVCGSVITVGLQLWLGLGLALVLRLGLGLGLALVLRLGLQIVVYKLLE